MPGMNTGPSQGFMSRFKQNLPSAINQVGSMMPGPMGQAAKLAGTIMKKPAVPKQPNSNTMPSTGTPGSQPPVNGPNAMPSAPVDNGMVRGPSHGIPMFGPGMNTGVVGPRPPMGGMPPPMGMPPMQPNPMGGMASGLMQAYNQLSQQQGMPPQRRMMY